MHRWKIPANQFVAAVQQPIHFRTISAGMRAANAFPGHIPREGFVS